MFEERLLEVRALTIWMSNKVEKSEYSYSRVYGLGDICIILKGKRDIMSTQNRKVGYYNFEFEKEVR